jgi:hypothetical protein
MKTTIIIALIWLCISGIAQIYKGSIDQEGVSIFGGICKIIMSIISLTLFVIYF